LLPPCSGVHCQHRNEVHGAMNRKNRTVLADRVARAAEAALAAQGYVSPIDVLVEIGWLDVRTVENWRRGQINCLERLSRSTCRAFWKR
jgi:hypothetical protein